MLRRKWLAPLQNSNRIEINEKFKFYIIGGLSSNALFRVNNKYLDRTELITVYLVLIVMQCMYK